MTRTMTIMMTMVVMVMVMSLELCCHRRPTPLLYKRRETLSLDDGLTSLWVFTSSCSVLSRSKSAFAGFPCPPKHPRKGGLRRSPGEKHARDEERSISRG